MMINAVYILKIDDRNSESINDILMLITGRTQYSPGCLKSEIWHNLDLTEIMVNEIWQTEQDLKRYISSPIFKRMLAVLELSAAPPEIRFCDCSQVRGLDFIENVLISGHNKVLSIE